MQSLQPLAIGHVGLAAGHVLELPGVGKQDLESALLQQLVQRIQYTCVLSMATDTTPWSCSQPAKSRNCPVVVPNWRTFGFSSPSCCGPHTQCSRLPSLAHSRAGGPERAPECLIECASNRAGADAPAGKASGSNAG